MTTRSGPDWRPCRVVESEPVADRARRITIERPAPLGRPAEPGSHVDVRVRLGGEHGATDVRSYSVVESDDKVVISLSQPDVTFLSRLAYSVAGIVSPTAYANNVMAYDRGRIAVGLTADIVVFDAENIADRATFAEPSRQSTPIPPRWMPSPRRTGTPFECPAGSG